MTTGMSLQRWKKLGQLDREISIYSKLAKKLDCIDIYTYGMNENHLLSEHKSLEVGVEKKSRFWARNIKSPRLHSYLNYCWNIYNLFAKRKYFNSIDILKTNQYRGSIFGVLIKKLYKKPLIVRMGWYHGHFKHPILRRKKVEEWVFNNADKVILTNELAKRYICDTYKIKSEDVAIIPNSIDTYLFSPCSHDKEYDVIYVGRLHKEKNLELLISALVLIKKPLKVLIVGDGDLEILKKIKAVNIHNIDYKKNVPNPELPNLLNKSRVFVLLSKYEGNPKTLLEAMSCSLPVIGNNASGISEIINDKETGLIVNNDPSELIKSIDKILNNNSFAKKLGENARQYIVENYNIDKIVNNEAQLIRSMLSNH